eukprot:gene5486-6171_t
MNPGSGAISWPSTPNRREITVVEIRNAITHPKDNGKKYTDFEICLKTNSKAFTLSRSSVRRRYSDFVWLRKWLSENNEGFSSIRKTPSLPPKKILGRFEDEFIEERMKGLQRFLRKVIEHNVFLSDKALHLFLQSNMKVAEIESYLVGKHVDIDLDFSSDHNSQNENKTCFDKMLEQRANSALQRNSQAIANDNVPSLAKVNEDHGNENEENGDHGSKDHVSGDHRNEDHRSEDHGSEDHESEDHKSEDHRSEDHGNQDHGSEDHGSEDCGNENHGNEEGPKQTDDVNFVYESFESLAECKSSTLDKIVENKKDDSQTHSKSNNDLEQATNNLTATKVVTEYTEEISSLSISDMSSYSLDNLEHLDEPESCQGDQN